MIKPFLRLCLWMPLLMVTFLIDTILSMMTLFMYLFLTKEEDMLFPRAMMKYFKMTKADYKLINNLNNGK